MQYKIYYFTRTGNCKRIADSLSKKLSCEPEQILDNQNWNGWLGWLKAGFYSSLDRKVEIHVPEDLQDAAEKIIVTPIWANKIVPAVRELLKLIPARSVHLVVSSIDTQINTPAGYLSVTNITQKSGKETEMIDELADMLAKKPVDLSLT